ncbi:hypothetical protein MNBD_GAMMA26-1509 [hydrothermal vent metagenome]|uniref:SprT-like domain-containing protein n=1 Tax=hydrothermal vent metagenome TaxID=652676 RepID=A0A3B1BVG0_9ZZZZ
MLPLVKQVIARTHALLDQAERNFKHTMPQPEIRFNLWGQSAGMVLFQKGCAPVVRFNQQLLRNNQAAFLTQTVPHEVAHMVARTLFGAKIQPHGQEWKDVMMWLGAKGQRCHNFDTRSTKTRRLRLFDYQCDCRSHQLTSIRHNRVRQGSSYYCRSCKQLLQEKACKG